MCLLALGSSTAAALPYEVYIDIENEDDLYDLLATGQISEASFDALLFLHQTRVEINRADRARLYLLPNLDYADVDRIIDYRKQAGAIHDLRDLVEAGVLAPERATPLAAFILIDPLEPPRAHPDAFIRTQGRWSGRHDRLPPPLAIQARVRALGKLDVGAAATLTRNRLHRVRWDASLNALVAGPERTRFEVPKLYLHWNGPSWEIIGGTYRIGFGQRLTFDVTNQATPNGFFGDYELRRGGGLTRACKRAAGELAQSPCPSLRVIHVTPDYAWTNRLTGVAVGLERRLGDGWVQGHAWGSYQAHRLLQNEIVVAADCDDPRRDQDLGCGVPPVYVHSGPLTEPAPAARFATLPFMYVEALGGGHLSYFWSARRHLGVTGYGAAPRSLVRGAAIGFQETARKPFGGAFGAVGVDAAFGFGSQDLFLEVARSFDNQGDGGGFGVLFRNVSTLPEATVDVSVRYYGSRYANPYARPISAPDELDGLRARDEAGLRLVATAELGPRVTVRALADCWRRLSSRALGTALLGRADWKLNTSWSWALWVEHQHGAQERLVVSTQLAYVSIRPVTLSAQLQHRLLAGSRNAKPLQHDVAATASLVTRPVDVLRIRFRVRYDFEDVSDNHRLRQMLWAYLDASFVHSQKHTLVFRYDLRAFLDLRASTLARAPNPEHWLLLEYVWRH